MHYTAPLQLLWAFRFRRNSPLTWEEQRRERVTDAAFFREKLTGRPKDLDLEHREDLTCGPR